jgi:hypothetical protein
MGLSTSFLRVTNDIADFYDGMRDYWSNRTLMQGYGEAAKDITEVVENATRNSNPLLQACAGSSLAVAKMMGGIPIGIDHWVIETARSTVHHGVGSGLKTLLGTSIEGFVDGGKFVINQVKKWSHGEISNSTFGVADEVATTLGTAGLMFLGIKGIHTGGTGVFNAIKNIEIHTPSLAYTTGQVMPVAAVSVGAIQGGPLATGLVYMNSTNNPPNGGSKERSGDIQKKLRRDELSQMDVETVVKMSALPELRSKILAAKIVSGDIQALQALLKLIKEGDKFPQKELLKLVMRNDNFETTLKRLVLCELTKLNDSRVLLDMNALNRITEELKPFEADFSSKPLLK